MGHHNLKMDTIEVGDKIQKSECAPPFHSTSAKREGGQTAWTLLTARFNIASRNIFGRPTFGLTNTEKDIIGLIEDEAREGVFMTMNEVISDSERMQEKFSRVTLLCSNVNDLSEAKEDAKAELDYHKKRLVNIEKEIKCAEAELRKTQEKREKGPLDLDRSLRKLLDEKKK